MPKPNPSVRMAQKGPASRTRLNSWPQKSMLFIAQQLPNRCRLVHISTHSTSCLLPDQECSLERTQTINLTSSPYHSTVLNELHNESDIFNDCRPQYTVNSPGKYVPKLFTATRSYFYSAPCIRLKYGSFGSVRQEM